MRIPWGKDVRTLDEVLAGLVEEKSRSYPSGLKSVYFDKAVDAVLEQGVIEMRSAGFRRRKRRVSGTECVYTTRKVR